jgi:hypothetical protein
VGAWNGLPVDVRSEVVAMIKAAQMRV